MAELPPTVRFTEAALSAVTAGEHVMSRESVGSRDSSAGPGAEQVTCSCTWSAPAPVPITHAAATWRAHVNEATSPVARRAAARRGGAR